MENVQFRLYYLYKMEKFLFYISFIFDLLAQSFLFILIWRETFNVNIVISISIILFCWVLCVCYPFLKKIKKQDWNTWYFLIYLLLTPSLVVNFFIPFLKFHWLLPESMIFNQWLFVILVTTPTYATNLFMVWAYYRKVKKLNEFEKFNTLFILCQMIYTIIIAISSIILSFFFKK